MVIISFISEFNGKKVVDTSRKEVGKFEDFIVFANDPYPLVDAIVVKIDKKSINVPWDHISDIKDNIKLKVDINDIIEYQTKENDIKLNTILDKQIVDANGKKIDRVNDIELSKIDHHYQLIGINVGFEGFLRRLGVENVLNDLKINVSGKYIAWKDVDISGSDEYNLKLTKTDSDLKKLHPSDISDIIKELNDKDLSNIINTLDDDLAASVLEEISSNRQFCLVDEIENEKTASILNKMSPDSATDLFGCLSKERADELLDLMNPEKANNIRKLLNYPPDTAGGIMTTDFAVINEKYTAQEILDYLRNLVKDVRFIYYIYLVSNGTLTGIASLKDVIFAHPNQRAVEFMTYDLITVNELDNQNDVAKKIAKYNLLAIPVVNDKNEIKGIVTVDDAISITLPSK